MQVVDNNGNIFGGGLQVNGPDGKPKTIGGGPPTGAAGGDLSGFYPNPGVVWSNGLPTYDLQYYPLTNPSGFITSATAAATYQPLLTLTTTGTSGAATLTGSTLNIPQYGGSSSLTVGTTAITSGTVGRVLFQGTGNVLQQSANLFWDNTNNRLGIGTASPSYTLQVAGTIKATGGTQAGAIFGAGVELTLASDAYIQCTSTTGKNAGLTIHRFSTAEYASLDFLNGGSFATGWSIQSRPSSTRLDIVDRNPTDNIRMCFHNGGNIGIGTTTNAGFKLDVNGTARVSGNLTLTGGSLLMNNNNIYIARGTGTATDGMEIRALSAGTDAVKVTTSSVSISSAGGLTYQASAQLAVDSTTRGFLPPRMTTAQKNAIATPAAGLIVYDTTLAKLCVRTASAWETITSV